MKYLSVIDFDGNNNRIYGFTETKRENLSKDIENFFTYNNDSITLDIFTVELNTKNGYSIWIDRNGIPEYVCKCPYGTMQDIKIHLDKHFSAEVPF